MSTPTEWIFQDDILVKSSVSYFSNDYIGMEEKSTLLFKNELERYSMKEHTLEMTSEESYDLRNLIQEANLKLSNPLADLTGDYDSHIRGLLYGQLCHGFSLSASVVYNPPSLLSNKKPWDIVRRSMSLWRNQFSQMKSMEQSMCPVVVANSAIAFHSKGTQKTRGTVINENVASNDYLSGSSRIEFGSIRNLEEEVISGSAHSTSLETQGTTAPAKQQRVARSSIYLKNEDGFPLSANKLH
ncbi:hypothetical protein BUALT_Bualt02G0073000 [Buddleja alternifolia]|uniref:Uncharacterized protein n=1 Tax=Buddleja alternifolia TaxID=168488 RepID=A0AAV6Y2E7_9LAMI|nr:hypothetical protein BUALT_Bualt02G0073000 [Buddleja alternifolia]